MVFIKFFFWLVFYIVFWWLFGDFQSFKSFKIVLPSRRNADFYNIDVFETWAKHGQKSLPGRHWNHWKLWRKSSQKQHLWQCASEDDVLFNFAAFLGRLGTLLGHLGTLLGSFAGHKSIQNPTTPQQHPTGPSSWRPRGPRKASRDDFRWIWDDF